MTGLRWTALLFLTIGLIGCGGSEGKTDASTAQSETAQQTSAQRTAAKTPTLKKVTHTDAMGVVKQSDAKITVINFWATWCVPCVEEFPAYVKLDDALDDRGVDVMFISTDFPNEKKKVISFLAEHGVTGTSYLKTGNTTEFVNGFSKEWTGAVPATFVYDSDGSLLSFWEGKVTYEELKARVTKHLSNA